MIGGYPPVELRGSLFLSLIFPIFPSKPGKKCISHGSLGSKSWMNQVGSSRLQRSYVGHDDDALYFDEVHKYMHTGRQINLAIGYEKQMNLRCPISRE